MNSAEAIDLNEQANSFVYEFLQERWNSSTSIPANVLVVASDIITFTDAVAEALRAVAELAASGATNLHNSSTTSAIMKYLDFGGLLGIGLSMGADVFNINTALSNGDTATLKSI